MANGTKSSATEFVVNDIYYSVLSAINYPEYIYPGFLSDLSDMSGVRISIKHTPVSFEKFRNIITEEINELKAKYQVEKDVNVQEEYRRDYEGKADTLSLLEQNHTRIFDFCIHFIISAKSLDELNEKKIELKRNLSSKGIKTIVLMFEQEEALMSAVPIFPMQDIEERVSMPMPAVTIGGMYPFTFDCLKDNGAGALIGADFSNGVILFNQFLYKTSQEAGRDNANALIIGMQQSGKTMLSKLLLSNHIRNGISTFCIDDTGEYSHIVEDEMGDVCDMDRGDGYCLINPLDIIDDMTEEEKSQGLGYTALSRTINQLKAFARYILSDLDNDSLNVFGNVLLETYQRFGITNNTNFAELNSNDMPTFDDVNATIRGKLMSMKEATKERELLEKIDNLVKILTNNYRKLFTGHTNIDFTQQDLLSFNTKFITMDNIKKALIFNALRYSWSLCVKNNKDSIIVIDSMELLLDRNNAYGVDFISQIVRKSKKYNTGTIMVASEVSALSRNELFPYGKILFDNTSYLFAFPNKKSVIETLSKYISLNDSEKESINYLNIGESFFKCGNRRLNIKIILTPEELEKFEIVN